ncbi:LysR substrate binding domain-containing protein [Paenibacillus sp. cl141a]|nr:LysR substrate binding domain-containing protein [Paenibacillus sp. cl141a]
MAVPPTHRLARNNRIRLSEAAGESFVGYKEGHPYQKMNNEFCKQAGFQPKVVCEVEDPGTIADLVRSGFGVALIGECRSSEELKLKKLSIQEPLARRVFQIAWLESRYLSKAAIAFRDYLVEYYADHGN